MKTTASNLFPTSFSSRGTTLGRTSATATDTDAGKPRETTDSKRLKNLQDALRLLKTTLSPKQMTKKAAAEKIAMLQRRLMQLKQLLLHATPEQAKVLARELKSIAGELASAAKAVAGASGGGQGTSIPSPVVSGNDGTASTSAASGTDADSVAASGTTQQNAEGAAAEASQEARGPTANDQATKGAQDQNAVSGVKRSNGTSDATEIPDNSLKDMLNEAKKLLKEVIAMVKLKMGHGDKASRQDIEDAEKKLREIDLATETQFSSAGFYTSQGLGMAEGGSVATGSSISAEA